jgi:uncharacterized membrane protein YfcA
VKLALSLAVAAAGALFTARWARIGIARTSLVHAAIGFWTNFFDALGIGSFAPTTAAYKLGGLVEDAKIPGTLNVGHTPAVAIEALIFLSIVEVEAWTLAVMIGAAMLGAVLGARQVAGWPKRKIQLGMSAALLAAAVFLTLGQLGIAAAGGTALGLRGGKLALAAAASAFFGSLMSLGIGFYAPCLTLVSALGMSPLASFPIMMGACAMLMPVAGTVFLARRAFDAKAAAGLLWGGVPGVLVAAMLVKSLPLAALRWLVIGVVTYTAVMMLRSAVSGVESRASQEADG